MNRSLALVLISAGVGIYGLYHLLLAVTMLPAPVSAVLFVAVLAQGVVGIAAAFAVWTRQAWAARALLLLGVCVAATALIEAFVLGILAYLYALLIAVVALVTALILGAWIQGDMGAPRKHAVL